MEQRIVDQLVETINNAIEMGTESLDELLNSVQPKDIESFPPETLEIMLDSYQIPEQLQKVVNEQYIKSGSDDVLLLKARLQLTKDKPASDAYSDAYQICSDAIQCLVHLQTNDLAQKDREIEDLVMRSLKIETLAATELEIKTKELRKVYHEVSKLLTQLEARFFHFESLRIYEEILNYEHPKLADIYHQLGLMYMKIGKDEQASEFYQKSYNIRVKCLPSNQKATAKTAFNLASILETKGDFLTAMELYSKCLEIREQTLPENDKNLEKIYQKVAILNGQFGDIKRSEQLHLKALKIQEANLPASQKNLATTYNYLGVIYDKQKDMEQSFEYYLKALQIQEEILPGNHADIGTTCYNLGLGYLRKKNMQKAEEMFMRTLTIREQAVTPNYLGLANTYYHLALVYKKTKNLKRAQEYLMKRLNVFDNIYAAEHPEVAKTKKWLAQIESKLVSDGQFDQYEYLNEFQCDTSVLGSNKSDEKTQNYGNGQEQVAKS